jgi:diguanylate cyclase (GGDEF)-like protein
MRSRARHGVAGPSAAPWPELTAASASPVVAPDEASRGGARGVVRVACLEGAGSLETPRATITGRPGAPAEALCAADAERTEHTRRTSSLRLLIIEDSPAYATLVEQMLSDALSDELVVTHASALGKAARVLREERIDCVLLDLSLPDAVGLEGLAVVQSAAPAVPVVVLTGTDDQALAMQAVGEGAQDYLVKRRADREQLARSIRYAIERRRSEARVARLAVHDSLTDLPNRVLLLDRLNVAIARCGRRPTGLALMFIDLDRFKSVNDRLGHDAGDELLIELAGRLRSILRPSDTVARFGGDEFLILCEEVRSEREAIHVAERARAAVAEPFELRGSEVTLGASVGITCARPAPTNAEALIREADMAMYRAKRQRTGIELYEAAMRAEAVAELETEHELRGASARGELQLHYQPEIALADGAPAFGVEALLRWEHPRAGFLLPSGFIGLAEESGLIVPIGEWVLLEACRQLGRWLHEHSAPGDLSVSVNVSPVQLSSPGFLDSVLHALSASGLQPRSLCIEVTESCVAQDPEGAARALHDLKSLGVQLALDDFGTGYSSLSALSSYPVDMVKIDRSFIAGVDRDPMVGRMFEAVLGVVRAAELQCVAEGVETHAQLDLLERIGCDAAQGYLLARPAPPGEILPWLRAVREVADE